MTFMQRCTAVNETLPKRYAAMGYMTNILTYLTLLPSERPKLYAILAFLSAIRLNYRGSLTFDSIF